MEILILTGVPGASFRHLARAWGRDKGFHMVLAQFICERHGDVERKKRQAEKKANLSIDGDVKELLQFKRRKVSRYGLELKEPKQPDDIGADVWDPSLYGDADTNEALASEIFDFSEKDFRRVTAKYRGITSALSESGSESAGSQNLMAQAAMTALLGDNNTDRMQQSLPEAVVTLAAMNRVPTSLQDEVNNQQSKSSDEASNASMIGHSLLQQVSGVANTSIHYSTNMQAQSESQIPQQQPQQQQYASQRIEAASLNGQSEQYTLQGQTQPQRQQITQVTTFFSGLENPLHQEVTNQPDYTLQQEMAAVSQTHFVHVQAPGNYVNQDNQHMLSNQDHLVNQHDTGTSGQYQPCQHQIAQIDAVPQQQQICINVVPHHPQPHHVMQQQSQRGLQPGPREHVTLSQHQIIQQVPQQSVVLEYNAQSHEQGQLQIPHSHFDAAVRQQDQQHQQLEQQTQSHYSETLQQQTQQVFAQQTNPNQYTAPPQVPRHQHHQNGTNQSHHNYAILQHNHHQQVSQHHRVTDQTQLLSRTQQQHVPHQGSQSLLDQQCVNPLHHEQQQHGSQPQQGFQCQVGQLSQPINHLNTHTSDSLRWQHQISRENVGGNNGLVANTNQQQDPGAQGPIPEQRLSPDALRSPDQQRLNHPIQCHADPSQHGHAQSQAQAQIQVLPQNWSSQPIPQTAYQHHIRHHRRQQSQPVNFQQDHNPSQHRHHRRQFSQPARPHDPTSVQVFSFSQQKGTTSQSAPQIFQHHESSIAQIGAHPQTNSNDHHARGQDLSQVSIQQQQHQETQLFQECHQQLQTPLNGNYHQENQVSQQESYLETALLHHSHPLQQTQEGGFHQQQEVSDGDLITQQFHHPPDEVGQDPLHIHNEMHVAQTNSIHRYEETPQGM
jgi:hypothetical protein